MIYKKESLDTFRIERHTGNKSNFLRLRLSEKPCATQINILTLPENEEATNLHADEILFYVEDGVNGIYEQFQRKFHIAEISFTPYNTPPPDRYDNLDFDFFKC